MCGGTIIGSTASAVSGRNRLSPPNGLSSCRSQKDKSLMCGGTIISESAKAEPISNRLSDFNDLS